MKIYVTHSKELDFVNELYIPIRSSKINEYHDITLPHEFNNQPFDSKNFMKNCDLIIAEVSHPSTGQGIELGWANLFNIPIVCFYRKGKKTAKSLNMLTDKIIEYENKEDFIDKLSREISNYQEII